METISSGAPTKRSTERHQTSLRCCKTPLLWIFVLGIAILSQATSSRAQESSASSTTQSIATEVEVFLNPDAPPVLNIRECLNLFDTLDQAVYICRHNSDMLPLLKYAERIAKDECESRFKNEQWNCSEFSLLKGPKINSGIRTYREGAYVDALSFAAIAHTIARACSSNLLHSCSCAEGPTESGSEESQPCTDNVNFGLRVAELFLNKRFTSSGRTLKHELIEHNFRAANMTIKNIVTNKCNCHGVSGSCSLQTCYSELQEFEVVAEELKKAYDNACKVRANGRSDNSWIPECEREYTESDLIYRNSRNWCVADPSIGALGTKGRRCDPNINGAGSCQNLCRGCDRNWVSREENRRSKCNCAFVWCCKIQCQTCVGIETVNECV